MKCRCLHFDTNRDLIDHLNFYRQATKGIRRIPDVAYNVYKKNFEEPTKSEGFESVTKVTFKPTFENDDEKQYFLKRLAE